MITLDLVERPFTERGSRLLVMAAHNRVTGAGDPVTDAGDGLWIARAEYERPLHDTTILTDLVLRDADGRVLPVVEATPVGVSFGEADSLEAASLLFADPDTLVLTGSGVSASWRAADGTPQSASVDGCLTLVGLPHVENAEAVLPENAGTVLSRAQDRWASWFAAMPPVRDDLRERAEMAWWTLAVNVLPIDGRELLVPSKYGYVGCWNWDALFHTIALRHVDPALARAQITAFLDHQLPDGQLPDVIHDGGALAETTDLPRSDRERLSRHVGQANGITAEAAGPVPVTKPPLVAWAVWKVHEVDPDLGFLADVHPQLVKAHEWWFAASDPDGDGLPEYLHPYSSGLDDSPIWDYGPRAEPPDLNSYLVLQADVLADIADALGRAGEAAEWRSRAEEHTALLVERRWRGDRFATLAAGDEIPVRTALELLPLLTGRLPTEISDALHTRLLSPSYWSTRPVPTVAFDDPTFDPDAMWRGPVWLNINYLLIEGLRRSGYAETADELRDRTLAMARDGGGLYEYWNPLTGARAGRATTGFGWSSALFVDLAAWSAGTQGSGQ